MILFNIEAEQHLISELLFDNKVYPELSRVITVEDFYDIKNQRAYSVIQDLVEHGEIADLVTVSAKLPDLSLYLAEISDIGKGRHENYARVVKEFSIRRQLKQLSEQIGKLSDQEGDIDDITSKSKSLIYSLPGIKKRMSNKEHMITLLGKLEEGDTNGPKTGIPILDKVTKGLKSGHVWAIGAYTNVGKTNFALTLAKNIMKTVPCWYVSLEMPVEDIQERLLHFMEVDGMDRGSAADLIGYNDNFTVFDEMRTIEDIYAEYTVCRNKPQVIFIDYIGLIRNDRKSEYERMTKIVDDIQDFAMRTGVCVVELSQISEEAQKGQNKTMGFKGSGSVAANAHVGIRLDVDNDLESDVVAFTVEVIKNRHGRKALQAYKFNKKNYSFIF